MTCSSSRASSGRSSTHSSMIDQAGASINGSRTATSDARFPGSRAPAATICPAAASTSPDATRAVAAIADPTSRPPRARAGCMAPGPARSVSDRYRRWRRPPRGARNTRCRLPATDRVPGGGVDDVERRLPGDLRRQTGGKQAHDAGADAKREPLDRRAPRSTANRSQDRRLPARTAPAPARPPAAAPAARRLGSCCVTEEPGPVLVPKVE